MKDYFVAVVAFLVSLALVFLWFTLSHVTTQRDSARAEVQRLKNAIEIVEIEARRKALLAAQQFAEEKQALLDAHLQEMKNADEVHGHLMADMERGAVRLRAQWRGCEARVDSLSAAAGPTSGDDESSELRRQGAADLVRVADECDAVIRWHQHYLTSLLNTLRDY